MNTNNITPPTISGHTGLICLLGSPVAHSISPAMHNTAFAATDLDFAYLAFDVTSDKVQDALDALKLFGARGCNLTMPLKNAVIPYLDDLSEAAGLSGSVNTIVIEDGRLIGHTTDGIGYTDALKKESGFDIRDKRITILGAGGAAESIIVQAALDGAKEIRIFKRNNNTFAAAVKFAESVAAKTQCVITVTPMEDAEALNKSVAESDLLINATNVGMGDDTRTLVPKDFFHRDLFVSDIIYHPNETTLLKEAKAAGCRTANGKYMLLYQGASAFALWTGQPMPVDVVKKTCFSSI